MVLQNAWRVAGYIPQLHSRAAGGTEDYKATMDSLHQHCMAFLFASVCAAYDAGGFYFSALGQMKKRDRQESRSQ